MTIRVAQIGVSRSGLQNPNFKAADTAGKVSLLGYGRGAALYVQASRPKSAASFFFEIAVLNLRSPASIYAGLVAIRNRRTMLALYISRAVLIVGLALVVAPRAAFADAACPSHPTQAIAQAKTALEAHHPKNDRLALECLLAAVTDLNAMVSGLPLKRAAPEKER